MAYEILDGAKVVTYLKNVRETGEYFGSDELEAREIGDGNLNHVWIVTSKSDPKKSLVLKQALPYLRCVGEEYPLGRERMTYEIHSMLEYEKIAPSFVPKIYHTNEEMSLMVMQNLDEHIIMRKGIVAAAEYPDFVEHISDFLALMLFKTSSFSLSSSAKRKAISRFNENTELCELTENFVFTFPYMENETNHYNDEIREDVMRIRTDPAFKQKAMELKYLFINRTDALIHGDLHTGSIMLNSKETYVIDSEFAFYGPIGFDVGAVVGNLLMAYASYFVRKNEAYRQWLLDAARSVLEQFLVKFRAHWDAEGPSAMMTAGYWDDCGEEAYESYKDSVMKQLLQESVGFAGCKMMRRQMGIAHVLDIDSIEDQKERAIAERTVIRIAREFVVRYKEINSVDHMMEVIQRAVQ